MDFSYWMTSASRVVLTTINIVTKLNYYWRRESIFKGLFISFGSYRSRRQFNRWGRHNSDTHYNAYSDAN